MKNMKKQYSLGLAVVGLLALSLFLSADRVQPSPVNAAPSAVQAQSIDELYYSACNCTPGSNGSWGNSSGDLDGFVWDATRGAWRWNEIGGNGGNLYCPVPYDRSVIGPIQIRVVVSDQSSRGEVRVDAFRQDIFGAPELADSAQTAPPSFRGNETLTVDVTPLESTRWIWIRVTVPWFNEDQSRVYGYRVLRP